MNEGCAGRRWQATRFPALKSPGNIAHHVVAVPAFGWHGVWRAADTGAVTGERDLASVFHVADGKVTRLARYDDLDEALAAAGLLRSDECGPV
jgi:hypothetical protein